MKAKLPMIARILFGLIFFLSGVAGLAQQMGLMPPPPVEGMPPAMLTYFQGIMASVYFMPLLKITETVCGLLILIGWFVPLCLVIMAPIVLNIFFIHAFLAPSGVPLALILGALLIYLAFFAPPYAPKVKALFHKK
ncbi:DoxX family membrane protein [Bdellovibrio sp. KM01]|uniref:DoxX family membrane protein n=1 Tax=Bdellovibrio sp. KM01 TaxID=2748865 RepID=UPI0015EA55C4|nr:DoxX family membrane protein [Bdellovibrio sp. KM01]QLY25783.1 DoxX family membrane protein [Bdellovibrio sp. KM01]